MSILVTIVGIINFICGILLVKKEDYRESGVLAIISGLTLIGIVIWHTFFIS